MSLFPSMADGVGRSHTGGRNVFSEGKGLLVFMMKSLISSAPGCFFIFIKHCVDRNLWKHVKTSVFIGRKKVFCRILSIVTFYFPSDMSLGVRMAQFVFLGETLSSYSKKERGETYLSCRRKVAVKCVGQRLRQNSPLIQHRSSLSCAAPWRVSHVPVA